MNNIDKQKYELAYNYLKRKGFSKRLFNRSKEKLQWLNSILQWYVDNKRENYYNLKFIRIEHKESFRSIFCKKYAIVLQFLIFLFIPIFVLGLLPAMAIIENSVIDILKLILCYFGCILIAYFIYILIGAPIYIRHLKYKTKFSFIYKYETGEPTPFSDFLNIIINDRIDENVAGEYDYDLRDLIICEAYYETIINSINYNIRHHRNLLEQFLYNIHSDGHWIESRIPLKHGNNAFNLIQELNNITYLSTQFSDTHIDIQLWEIPNKNPEFKEFIQNYKSYRLIKIGQRMALIVLLLLYPIYSRWNYVSDKLVEQEYNDAIVKYESLLDKIKKHNWIPLSITVSNSLIDNNHVGNDWECYNYVNGERMSKDYRIHYNFGDTLHLYNEIIEYDSWNDVGTSNKFVYFTFESFLQNRNIIKSVTETSVIENRGKYCGCSALWETIYEFSCCANLDRPNRSDFVKKVKRRILQNFFNFEL